MFLPSRWREFVEHHFNRENNIFSLGYGTWWCCSIQIGSGLLRFMIFRLNETEDRITLFGGGEHTGDGDALLNWLEATESEDYDEYVTPEGITYCFPRVQPVTSRVPVPLMEVGRYMTCRMRGWDVSIRSREYIGTEVRIWIETPETQIRYCYAEDIYSLETKELFQTLKHRSTYGEEDIKTKQCIFMEGRSLVSKPIQYFLCPLKQYCESRFE